MKNTLVSISAIPSANTFSGDLELSEDAIILKLLAKYNRGAVSALIDIPVAASLVFDAFVWLDSTDLSFLKVPRIFCPPSTESAGQFLLCFSDSFAYDMPYLN